LKTFFLKNQSTTESKLFFAALTEFNRNRMCLKSKEVIDREELADI